VAGRRARKEWEARVEATTRERHPSDLTAARHTWDHELSTEQQFRIIQELVDTRAADWCRAYSNVIDVLQGYGTQRNAEGRRTVVRKPCITFVVKRKWRGQRVTKPEQRLPRYVLTYVGLRRRRKLCAVPTDVEDAATYRQVEIQNLNVWVHCQQADLQIPGVVTCAVKTRYGQDKWFALSCRHVLALSKYVHPRLYAGSRVRVSSPGGRQLGLTLGLYGQLADQPAVSLDAQLAEVTSVTALRRALRGLTLSGYAVRWSELPDTYYIRCPGEPIYAEKVRRVTHETLDYERCGIHYVLHSELIESLVAPGATQPGYSGSPVVSEPGQLLLGMHIAGGGDTAYMIPAWDLFKPENYHGMAPSDRIMLGNP
jgi:hypothetical protein